MEMDCCSSRLHVHGMQCMLCACAFFLSRLCILVCKDACLQSTPASLHACSAMSAGVLLLVTESGLALLHQTLHECRRAPFGHGKWLGVASSRAPCPPSPSRWVGETKWVKPGVLVKGGVQWVELRVRLMG